MTAPISQALKNLIERQRRQYGPPPKIEDLPPTKGINRKAYSSNPAAKWLKPLAVVVPKVQAAPPSPNRHDRRAQSRFDRRQRAELARALERYNRESRTVGASGRRNQGALRASGVEIIKALMFQWWNAKTGRLDPAQSTIAEFTGWSVSTVRRALAAAARIGVLSWVRRPAFFVAGAWKRHTNSYQISAGTTVNILDKGFDGVQTVEAAACETRRNSNGAFSAKFLI